MKRFAIIFPLLLAIGVMAQTPGWSPADLVRVGKLPVATSSGDYTNGMVTWFHAATLTNAAGTKIVTWTDSATSAFVATLNTGDAYRQDNLLNGKTGAATTNLTSGGLNFTAPDVTSFTVIWVGRILAAGSEGGIFSHRVVGGNGFALTGDTGGAYQPHLVVMNSGGEVINRKATVITAPTGTIQIAWTWNGTTAHCYTNGVEDTSVTAGDTGFGINVGAIGYGYATSTCHIGEIRVYNSVLSSENLAAASAALKTYWGTP